MRRWIRVGSSTLDPSLAINDVELAIEDPPSGEPDDAPPEDPPQEGAGP